MHKPWVIGATLLAFFCSAFLVNQKLGYHTAIRMDSAESVHQLGDVITLTVEMSNRSWLPIVKYIGCTDIPLIKINDKKVRLDSHPCFLREERGIEIFSPHFKRSHTWEFVLVNEASDFDRITSLYGRAPFNVIVSPGENILTATEWGEVTAKTSFVVAPENFISEPMDCGLFGAGNEGRADLCHYTRCEASSDPSCCSRIGTAVPKLKDTCYSLAAQKNDSRDICAHIVNDRTREWCVMNVIRQQKKFDDCVQIKDTHYRDICLQEGFDAKLRTTLDEDLCEALIPSSPYAAEACYHKLAVYATDPVLCTRYAYARNTSSIQYASLQCFERVSKVMGERFTCDTTHDASYQALCSIELAVMHNTPETCESIDPAFHDMCYMTLGSRRNWEIEKKYCDKIDDKSYVKERCLRAVKEYKIQQEFFD